MQKDSAILEIGDMELCTFCKPDLITTHTPYLKKL